jgi:eukaryotic-like serine/threonine-protein kinase
MRRSGSSEARLLPGTEGAFGPFFSPDGGSVGFFANSGSSAELKVIPLQGGVARTVVSDSATGFGADWADDGHIYFAHANRGIAKIPGGGGEIVQITRVDSVGGVSEHDFVDVLPGSRFAVATLWLGSIGSNRIGLVDLGTGRIAVLTDGTMARYAEPGFLIVGDADGSLLAARIDAKTGKVSGTPTLVLRNVAVEGVNGSVQFAVSASGTLVYQADVSGGGVLNWVGRDGTAVPVDSAMKGIFSSMSVSPDGRAIALARSEAGGEAVWIKYLPAGAFTKLSTDVVDANRPAWSPDGRHVAFLGLRNNLRLPWIRRADASDQTRPAVPGGQEFDEILFRPRGREVLLRTRGLGPGTRHLMVFDPAVDSLPRDLLRSRADHYSIAFSPDGRWLAYVSEESGTPEVYVRPYPNVDSARIAISVGGGAEPLWSRDGSEVFYRSPRGGVVSTRVSTRPTFAARPPEMLFTVNQVVIGQYFRAWDVHPDGRFLMSDAGGNDVTRLEVVFNWTRELERLNAGSATR